MAQIATGSEPLPEVARAIEEIDPTAQGYIAERVLPPISPVSEKTGQLKFIDREDMIRVNDRVKMSPGSTYGRSGYRTSRQTYTCEKYGWEDDINDEDRKTTETSFDVEEQSGKYCAGKVMLKLEDEVSSLIFDTNTWTGDSLATTVSTAWSDSSATIVKDVTAAAEKVREGTGIKPNALILGAAEMQHMLYNDDIVGRFSNDMMVTPAQIRANVAGLFDLQYLLVGGAIKNTAAEGASISTSDFWQSGYAMVAKIAETSDPREVCLGRSVPWEGMDNTTYEAMLYREPQTDSDVVKVRRYLDLKVLDAALGHLIDTTP